jgi:pimeloyl-ACP methyl ester carboxylesterase
MQARLVATAVPQRPRGVVVVIHGGGSRGQRRAVSPTQLSVLRMVPFARAMAKAGDRQWAVYRLLNTYRGWDGSHTPIQDVEWAMAEIAKTHPELPVCLVGHSLGARAALFAGDHPAVAGIVALNAWVYRSDDVDLAGREVLFVHGDQDRVADAGRALAVARSASRAATVRFEVIGGGNHSMLRSAAEFRGAATRFLREVLAGV